ncbi:hypothetical protein DITRI_Ditri13aG0143900 [Diplodiscus trichospermus]
MNRFQQLCSLVFIIILVFTPRIQAIRRNILASDPSATIITRQQPRKQVFHPGSSSSNFTGQAWQFEEKRRVPTGSNPLHNKR